jgi:hypothetical protein
MSDENLRRDREIELIRDKIGNGYVEQARQARAKLYFIWKSELK